MQQIQRAPHIVICLTVLALGSLIVTFLSCDDVPPSTMLPPTLTYEATRGATYHVNSAPDTRITQAPDGFANLPTTFEFIGFDTEDAAELLTYSFSIDEEDWSPWQSETKIVIFELQPGEHVFVVKARDTEDYEDETPASHLFEVDLEQPDTWITAGPSGTISETEVYFEFTGRDNRSETEQLQYSFDFDQWGWSKFSVQNWIFFRDLEEGTHEFSVRCRDQAGNIDATPDHCIFYIDCAG